MRHTYFAWGTALIVLLISCMGAPGQAAGGDEGAGDAAQGGDFGGGGFGGGGGFAQFTPRSGAEDDIVEDISREVRLLRKESTTQIAENPHRPETPKITMDRSPKTAQMEEKLSKKNDFSFVEAPLIHVAGWFREQLGINVRLDTQSLADENISPAEDTITFSAKQISYRAALNLCLQDLNLSWITDNNLLLITSPQKAEETLRTRVYPVWDLVQPTANALDEADYETLLDCIVTTISPDSWDIVGGPASISSYKGMLTIAQTQDNQDRIKRLLEAMRKFAVDRVPNTVRHTELKHVGCDDTEVTARISGALKRNVSLNYTEVPLSDFAAAVQDDARIPILLDKQSLADENIDPKFDTITVNLESVQLGDALRLVLADHNLATVIDHEAVVITSKDKAEETLRTRVYGCAALINDSGPGTEDEVSEEFDDLVGNVQSTIAFNTWDEVGGPGSIAVFPSRSLLIVSNTDAVHEKLTNYLEMLVAGRQGENSEPSRAWNPAEVQVKLYRLARDYRTADKRAAIADTLAGLVARCDNAVNVSPNGYFIRTAGDHLLIGHRRDAHPLFERIMRKLNVLDTGAAVVPAWGGPGGGMGGMGGMGGGMGGAGLF